MMAAYSIRSRFWAIVLIVWVTAITASAATVWISVRPHLDYNQTQTLESVAETTLLRLRDALMQETMVLDFMARQPALISAAMGLDADSFLLSDYLESFPPSAGVVRITLHDFAGVQIAEKVYREEAAYAFPLERRAELMQDVIARADSIGETEDVPLLYHDHADVAHVFVATPILIGDSLQGVIAAQLEIGLLETIPTTKVIRSMSLEDRYGSDQHATHDASGYEQNWPGSHYQVPGFDLTLFIQPDWAVLRDAGATLVRDMVLALSAALGAPFILLAVLGQRAIVLPHLRLHKQKKALAELAAIAEKANDAIIVTDLSGSIEWANRAFEKLSGLSIQDVRGRRPGTFLQGPETDPVARAAIRQGLATRIPVQTEILNYSADGRPYWISLSISPLFDERDEPYGFVAISNDITERRQRHAELNEAKARIEHQANHDALTDLPNRRAFDIALAARGANPGAAGVTVVRIDLDHFKYVNDTHGHAAGDVVLINVAAILRDETKAADIAARVGGDEFVILMARDHDIEAASQMARRILKRISAPIAHAGATLSVGASFGIATTADGQLSVEDVILAADVALYEAKEAGRNGVYLYTPALHARATEHRDIAARLGGAISREEFVPFYQPQIDARSGALLGLEVLSRWEQPGGVMLSPDRYLPVAEKIGLLNSVDAALFHRTAREIGALNSGERLVPKVSFNVTAQRLTDPEVLDAAVALAEKAEFQIVFEILESVLMDGQTTAMGFQLDRLREAGIGIQIDDFGTGHASIVGLLSARPDGLKIDQQLIHPLSDSSGAMRMVSAIVDIARALRIDVIAEGVETARQAEILLALGVPVQQGFFYARPMRAADLDTYLESKPVDRLSGTIIPAVKRMA